MQERHTGVEVEMLQLQTEWTHYMLQHLRSLELTLLL